MAQVVYNHFKYRSMMGLEIPGTADWRMLLLEVTAAGAYNPDLDTVADLLAVPTVAELIAAGYARKVLTGEGGAEDDANDWALADCDTITWAALGAPTDSVAAAVIYNEGGGADATRTLCFYFDTGLPLALAGIEFSLTTPNGIARAA